jgi:hypothetical protein
MWVQPHPRLARLNVKDLVWKWTEVEKRLSRHEENHMSRSDASFPDFSKPFVIHTDASHTQLGAGHLSDGKPIASYSRKLNSLRKHDTQPLNVSC